MGVIVSPLRLCLRKNTLQCRDNVTAWLDTCFFYTGRVARTSMAASHHEFYEYWQQQASTPSKVSDIQRVNLRTLLQAANYGNANSGTVVCPLRGPWNGDGPGEDPFCGEIIINAIPGYRVSI